MEETQATQDTNDRNQTEVAMTRNALTAAEASEIVRTRHIVPLEPIIETGNRGSWEYCSLRDHNHVVLTQRYRHVNCDAMTDRDGKCIACGADSPASIGW